MFAKWFRIALVMAGTLMVGQVLGQQNSTVFPWNSGYPGGTQPGLGAPTNPLPAEPTVIAPPITTPAAPAITGAAATGTLRSGEEEQEESALDAGRAFIELRVPANAEIWFEGDRTMQAGT